MDKLNRLCSPMHPMDENLDETEAIRQKRIEFIKLRELSKSPYSIGTVNDLQNKLSKLEEQIKGFQSNYSWEDLDSDKDSDDIDDKPKKSNLNSRTEQKEIDQFAGIFSIVSTVAFNKPDRIKKIVKKTIKPINKARNMSQDKELPKFIELCQHPGFNIFKMTELPFHIDVEFVLRRVHKAQPLSFVNKHKIFFEKWFYCQSIQKIIKDMFWYFFICKYGSDIDKSDMINYFTRAASNYVDFLYKITAESLYYQEKFKKNLPDLLSQTLYASLSECFPDSWIQFNDQFIESVIQLVFFWLSGIRPTKGLWHHWNMQELKPTEQKLKEKAIQEQSILGYTNDQLKKKSFDSETVKPVLLKTTMVGALNSTNNFLFNLNGQSPLIQHYLQKNQYNINVGTNNLIKHKEILPIISANNCETFADVVSKSLNGIKKRNENYKKFHDRNVFENLRFLRKQKLNNTDNEKRQEKLLNNKSKVHNLSNLMMHEYLKDKDSISFGADKAVIEAIMSTE